MEKGSSMPSAISILPAAEINAIKWDDCIAQSKAAIYSSTAYLNALVPHWYGLVIDDYRAVMALPVRKKWGVSYVYTPAFTQQLGLTGSYTEKDFIDALHAVKQWVPYGDYFFNHQNYSSEHLHGFTARNNYIISLSKSYTEIVQHFNTNVKRILKKTTEENFVYAPSSNIADSIALHRQLHQHKTKHVSRADYIRLTECCMQLWKENKCISRTVTDHNKQVLSTIVLLRDAHRLYNIINATTHEGKLLHASHFLMNEVIKEFAGSNLILDLEGSQIEGIKVFYERLGAVNEPYFHWHFNHLPFPLSLFKR
jgi:hypothetical protein